MKMMMKARLTALLLILFSTITSSSAAKFPIAKPGCPDRCGDVEIPYPFGIGEGCYRDPLFIIDCFNNSNSPDARPVPFWGNASSSSLRVSSVSVADGYFELLMGISRSCYNESGIVGANNVPSISLGSPRFTISTSSNKFVVIGCDDVGSFFGSNRTGGKDSRNGCISYCSTVDDITDGSCNGIGCCEAPIPPGRWKYNISLVTFNRHSRVLEDNPCGYAFLIATKYFSFSKTNLTGLRNVSRLPINVDWVIRNMPCEVAKQNTTSYECKWSNTQCVDHPENLGYRCNCTRGFEGNPYLGNCTDINECTDGEHRCLEESVCRNTEGDYVCDCKEGYEGDGKEEGGCKLKVFSQDTSKYYKIIAGTSVGGMFILIVGCLLYYKNKRRKLQQAREKFFRDNGGELLQNQLSSNENGHSTKIFSIDELKKASNNFDVNRIVGEGGFGTVYKGYLADTSVIAIKRAKAIDRNQIDSFINEVLVLSQINHRNVVKLLGCCLETEIPLLVYEFVDNGTLSEHIHDAKKSYVISFQMRLKIAAESAGVLSYLHSAASPLGL